MIFLLISTLVLSTVLFLAFLLNQQVKFIIFVLEFVTTIYDLITLPVYLLIDQPSKTKLRSKTVTAERHHKIKNDYYSYYYWKAKESPQKLSGEHQALKSLLAKLSHLSELLTVVEKVHKGKKCLGRRKILNKKIENGKVKFKLSNEFEWRSYDEVLASIRGFAKVLHHKFQLKQGDRVATFAETSPELFIMFFALQLLGCEVVILRSTPNKSKVPFVLNFNEVKLVFTQTNFIQLLNKMKPQIPNVAKLICFHHPFESKTDKEEIRNVQYEFFEYDQLLKEARDFPSFDFKKNVAFSSSDVANVITTSGSSDLPKSVLVTHANWIALFKTLKFESNSEHTFLACLEGSHVMELAREVLNFVSGTKMAYGNQRTLLNDSGLLADGCCGDLKASKATHIIGHTLTFEHIRSSIEMWTRNGPPILAAIYDFAFEYKKWWAKRCFRCPLVDVLFFQSIKNEFSETLKLVSAGAPLRSETNEFLRIYLDLNVTIEYGATIRAAISTFKRFDYDNEALTIVDGVKLRLENWQEGGYRVDDKPNARGEIIIGSDMVSAGYYKNEKETIESFFEEDGTRWWRSGDIGEINEYGQLKIIGRKRNFSKSALMDRKQTDKVQVTFLRKAPCLKSGTHLLEHDWYYV